jgi:hypothetical protein
LKSQWIGNYKNIINKIPNVVIGIIRLIKCLEVMNGLLFIDFILPLIYSCPSQGKKLAKEVWKLKGLCETTQGQDSLLMQVPCWTWFVGARVE